MEKSIQVPNQLFSSSEMIGQDYLAVGGLAYIYVYNATSGALVRQILASGGVTSIILISEKYFVCASDKDIIILKTQTLLVHNTIFNAHASNIQHLKLFKDQILSVSSDGWIRLWDLTTFQKNHEFQSCATLYSLELIENNHIAIGCSNGNVKIYDPTGFTLVATLSTGFSRVSSLKYLKKDLLACGLGSGFISIWDTLNRIKVKELSQHTTIVYSLELIGENLLASGSDDNTIKIWDISTGSLVQSFSAHSQMIYSIKYISGIFFSKTFFS